MYAILSDIHGNFFALESVVKDLKHYEIDGIILLGDLIDYGMQSNEVVRYIRDELNDQIICNIWGNHEKAIIEQDYTCFSSNRGVESAKYTRSILGDDVVLYLKNKLLNEGMYRFRFEKINALSIHGSLEDFFWKAIMPNNVRGKYDEFDVVFSGHSHYSHLFTEFYKTNDMQRRNKHSVMFINPGSVGQPRNHNPNAQYALYNPQKGNVIFRSVKYDVEAAMTMYDGSIDIFYRDRLKYGV